MKSLNLIATGLATTAGALSVQAQKVEQPNIIMIMVDDMGFSDIGPYGASDIETPNLDQLASEGIRFRQFYNNSISAPTRASLITGQYQHRAGVGYFNVDLGLPAYQGFLNRESLTFGEVLRTAGYTTLMSGKWHVGEQQDQLPNQRGFDHFFGFPGGFSCYYDRDNGKSRFKMELIKDNKPYKLQSDEHLTDAIGDHALEFIQDASQKKNPFFLYLAFNAPHWPLQAKPSNIEKYRGKYALGWDSLRQQRFENAKKQGVVSATQELADHDEKLKEWSSLTYYEKEYWQRRQEVYAAMIDEVDQQIGRLLAKLKEVGRYDNTLIVFISDNGAQGGGPQAHDFDASGPVGTPGTFYIQNACWSQTGNSPLRDYKGRPYEGGIGAPFIAWYPNRIKGGSIVDGVAHLIDLAPTFYDLAKAKYPKTYNGVTTNALPGRSLVPVLTGKRDVVDRGEPLFWERAGNHAVRDGRWKLISLYPEKKVELYDIDTDRAERHNVAFEHPDIVARLTAAYGNWALQNDVVDYSLLDRRARQGMNLFK